VSIALHRATEPLPLIQPLSARFSLAGTGLSARPSPRPSPPSAIRREDIAAAIAAMMRRGAVADSSGSDAAGSSSSSSATADDAAGCCCTSGGSGSAGQPESPARSPAPLATRAVRASANCTLPTAAVREDEGPASDGRRVESSAALQSQVSLFRCWAAFCSCPIGRVAKHPCCRPS
jgi:hypothetical protein